MKKKFLITISIVLVTFLSISTLVVFAGNRNNTEFTEEESAAKEIVHEESNAVFGEFYEEELNTGKYNTDGKDDLEKQIMLGDLNAAARGKLIRVQTEEVIEICRKYGHLTENISYDDIDTMDKYANLAIICCDTLNDTEIVLTAEERVRLHNYLDRSYSNLTDLSFEQTDKTMTAYETIEKTITPKYGISQTVQRR